jgi:hypothetical protein
MVIHRGAAFDILVTACDAFRFAELCALPPVEVSGVASMSLSTARLGALGQPVLHRAHQIDRGERELLQTSRIGLRVPDSHSDVAVVNRSKYYYAHHTCHCGPDR